MKKSLFFSNHLFMNCSKVGHNTCNRIESVLHLFRAQGYSFQSCSSVPHLYRGIFIFLAFKCLLKHSISLFRHQFLRNTECDGRDALSLDLCTNHAFICSSFGIINWLFGPKRNMYWFWSIDSLRWGKKFTKTQELSNLSKLF
jgi:hypothetical protein